MPYAKLVVSLAACLCPSVSTSVTYLLLARVFVHIVNNSIEFLTALSPILHTVDHLYIMIVGMRQISGSLVPYRGHLQDTLLPLEASYRTLRNEFC